MEDLNPLTLPLSGVRLIEASAGTGKTYTVVLLYLRAVLGLGIAQALSVKHLLVVTFTEAATQELRERIRSSVRELRHACVADDNAHPLSTLITDKQEAIWRLTIAEREMDEAAIYTIHGFCQRMLTTYAFDAQRSFEQTLVEDEKRLQHQVIHDFWRRHFYALPKPVISLIVQFWPSPVALLNELAPYLKRVPLTALGSDCDQLTLSDALIQDYQQIKQCIEHVKAAWSIITPTVESLITDSGIDKRSYSRAHLPKWIEVVNVWANDVTDTLMMPETLSRFSQQQLNDKTKKGTPPYAPVFEKIDELIAQFLPLKQRIIERSLQEIAHKLKDVKQSTRQFGYDDLLIQLKEALQAENRGNALAEKIAARFPIAMIDEFQDTDPVQYSLFSLIYPRSNKTGLMLIGDPKQAIYGFRGADIFTYIQAKSDSDAVYTMRTNWRSSNRVVDAINALFMRHPLPFLFDKIPFIHVDAAPPNHGLLFDYNDKPMPAINYCVLPGKMVSISHYQQQMAVYCAEQIQAWLMASQQRRAWLREGDTQRAVTAEDIAVLVRTRYEAEFIKQALQERGVASLFLSNRDSVFHTQEAKALRWLLRAVLSPNHVSWLKSALGCHLLGYTFEQLEQLNEDDAVWDRLVEQFLRYQRCWTKQGILPMLRLVMNEFQIAETLLATDNGERQLTDLMQLSELLQEAASMVESNDALVRWLTQQIEAEHTPPEQHQQRLESDKSVIKIVTIHQSKGLEYPIVWLPFPCSYRVAKQGAYHDEEDQQRHLVFTPDLATQQRIDKERLAEDLRLVYVALTRAIYHCAVGIASIEKKGKHSDTKLSAINYLLCYQPTISDEMAIAQLNELTSSTVTWLPPPSPIRHFVAAQQQGTPLQANQFTRSLFDPWRVTSYSELVQHQSAFSQHITPYLDRDRTSEGSVNALLTRSAHTFPKGAKVGTILHQFMESLDFTQPVTTAQCESITMRLALDAAWHPILTQWFSQVLTAQLNKEGLSLSLITSSQRLIELAFHLPVKHRFSLAKLNQLLQRYDPLSARGRHLEFPQFEGMIKGFVDLIFCWQGKYYLVDYKSNWLGENSADYSSAAIESVIVEHRYDLQYQLYTLALHRYLRHRLPVYNYAHHFGGIYYLFLRGMTGESDPQTGMFYCRLEHAFVEALDQLIG